MKIKHSISQTLTLRVSAPLRDKKSYIYLPTPKKQYRVSIAHPTIIIPSPVQFFAYPT